MQRDEALALVQLEVFLPSESLQPRRLFLLSALTHS